MNGAESLVRTLLGPGVKVCFVNPGTSEMHFVAALGAPTVGRNVMRMFDMVDPKLDWVALAKGHGVEAVHVTTTEALPRRRSAMGHS